jgi:hypothetical protein
MDAVVAIVEVQKKNITHFSIIFFGQHFVVS